MDKKPTTLLVQVSTRDKLKQYGRKTQTFDDILQELLKIAESFDAKTLNDSNRS